MRAVQILRHGGPDVLHQVTLPDPEPGPDEVVVRNRYIGVNYVDLQHRLGVSYPVRLPLVPETEAAGAVVSVGANADPALLDREVVHFGHLAGAYAELTAVMCAAAEGRRSPRIARPAAPDRRCRGPPAPRHPCS
jgi:NADPH2:quinone reductase